MLMSPSENKTTTNMNKKEKQIEEIKARIAIVRAEIKKKANSRIRVIRAVDLMIWHEQMKNLEREFFAAYGSGFKAYEQRYGTVAELK